MIRLAADKVLRETGSRFPDPACPAIIGLGSRVIRGMPAPIVNIFPLPFYHGSVAAHSANKDALMREITLPFVPLADRPARQAEPRMNGAFRPGSCRLRHDPPRRNRSTDFRHQKEGTES